jgi:hypothetical protein
MTEPVPSSVDMSDPVVARYLRDRAAQAAVDGGVQRVDLDAEAAEQASRGWSYVAMTFSPLVGIFGLRLHREAARLRAVGDHHGAARCTRNAERVALAGIALWMGFAVAAVAMLWFRG